MVAIPKAVGSSDRSLAPHLEFSPGYLLPGCSEGVYWVYRWDGSKVQKICFPKLVGKIFSSLERAGCFSYQNVAPSWSGAIHLSSFLFFEVHDCPAVFIYTTGHLSETLAGRVSLLLFNQ